MIANPDRTTLLSSLGWVDHDALWHYDVPSGRSKTTPLNSGARYASLHHLGSARFSVAHHFDGTIFEITVRGFANPSEVLSRAVLQPGRSELTGDSSAWLDVPRLYVEYLGFPPWNDFVLVKVTPTTGTIEAQRLAWYDDSYDKGYQGVINVLELPGEDCAVISVQRSSLLILHDLVTGAARQSVDLGGHLGNPMMALGNAGKEIWATDYDTIVVIRRSDWHVARSTRLQDAAPGTQQFIGDFSFAPDAGFCAVARPFSGDVVGIDLRSLAIQSSARLGQQPLEVVALPGGEVVARDWKSGAVLRGKLES